MHCTDVDAFSATARDHAQRPRNQGTPDKFDGHARITGPCGDTMEFWLTVKDDRIEHAFFTTDGCGPSLACGSMATTLAAGKTVTDALQIGQQEILHELGGLPAEFEHCALLASDTLKSACNDFTARQNKKSCDSCDKAECPALERKQNESDKEFEERQQLQSRLCRIKHRVVILSGKGGVGKSTVAVNLAVALMLEGKKTGLLDIDIHGPSIPTMLGLESETVTGGGEGLIPVELGDLKIMSLGFLLRNPDDAVIWRGPMKMGVIKQFLKDVDWGDLDYLIIDSPPGTGDEPLSVCQLIGALDGAVIVTTPQKVAAVDVRKSITFCRQLQVPVLGVVENMSGFTCPKCGTVTQILPSGGGKRIAEDMGVPFLGAIPLDPRIAEACDSGRIFIHHFAESQTAKIMKQIIQPIIVSSEKGENNT